MTTPDLWLDAIILGTRDITPTVREFQLRYPKSVHTAPGAHVDVQAMVNGQPCTRSYSVVRADAKDTLTIAVKQVPDSRGGSRYMWTLAPGARIRASAPKSNFEPVYDASPCLLIAGGIGITPLLSLAHALVARRAPVQMLYAARDRAELAYVDDLRSMLGDALSTFVSSEGEHLDVAHELRALPADAQVYLCGPMGLMDAVRASWSSQGRDRSRLRYETFGSSGRLAPEAFTVHIPRLALEVHVPATQTMLDALTDAGVAMVSNCRRGECGLCVVDVLDAHGEIDHRDVFFTPEQHAQRSKVCTCVSRLAGGRITIDPPWRGDPDLTQTDVLAR